MTFALEADRERQELGRRRLFVAQTRASDFLWEDSAPRTLVLDGFTAPTVDASRGAALLVPFEDRAVTKMRAWAYGGQWVGTGTVRDAAGAGRRYVDWAEAESRLGTALPSDYKRMVETFGHGAFDGYLDLNQEPWTDLRDDGLLIWAGTEHEDLYCWRADAGDPGRWPVVVRPFDGKNLHFDCQTAEFVCRILVDPHHPYTMAGYFDTH